MSVGNAYDGTIAVALRLAQEHILRGIGRAAGGAGLVTGAVKLSALGVDPLHCGDAGEDTAATLGNYTELEPGNIVRRSTRRAAGDLADHGAAVIVLPIRPGIMPADGLAIEQQSRDRLAERPGQFAVGAGLAFIDLRAFGVNAEHNGFSRRRNGVGRS